MIAFLISNWRYIGTSVATLALAYLLHTISLSFIERGHAIELKNLETKLVAECQANQEITREVSDEYQKEIANLNRRVRELKRVPNHCVPIPDGPRGRYGATGQGKYVGPHGVSSYSLYEYAGDAEQYRIQLIACQKFINKLK